MKIGVDGSSLAFPRTGVGNYIEALLTPLTRQEQEVQFFVYSQRHLQLESRSNLHLRVDEGPIGGPVWRNLRLPRLLHRDHVDVFWSGTGLLPAVGLRNLPTVLTVLDLVYLFAAETMPWQGRLSRSVFQPRSVRMATRVVAISRATALDMERACGRAADAIISPVVSQAFKIPTDAEKDRVRVKYQLHEPYLFTVGTLEPRKNLVSLLIAYNLLRGRGIRPPMLIIAGGKGWNDKQLSARLKAATESGMVRCLGFVDEDDLAGLYGAALAFIFPSFYEGFGMPLVEAQLCGTPVLYSDHPAMREAAGDFGIIFEPTPERIASVLAQIASGNCPLTCRLPQLIPNSAEDSARRMWDVIMSASRLREKVPGIPINYRTIP
ncbi:MAG TPA: glycosyltransferase family 1 protein [Acidobacteriaceae bacterium]|nr:glycosyltransferase family 1 protein [Acidobacteriaceae bacterium]